MCVCEVTLVVSYSLLPCGPYLGEGNGTPLQYFAWKIPWMEEPGRLQSMGSLRVGHDCATSLSLFTFMHWRRKWQPTPVFLPGESQGRGSLMAAVRGITQSRTQLKRLSSSRTIPLSMGCSRQEYWLLLLLLSCFSCVQLCDPIDSSPPDSPVPGILQARTLEWVAISFSNA